MIKPLRDTGFTLRWLLQAGLGVLLIVLLGVHLIVNHWVAPHGLLTYAEVIRYYDISGIAWMESIFLFVVTVHCLLGLHAMILDLNLSSGIAHLLSRVLILVGTLAILYGLWLITMIHSLAVS